METVRDFILGGSKITADGDCSHEIKRHLLLGRKAMTNLDSILKSRDITAVVHGMTESDTTEATQQQQQQQQLGHSFSSKKQASFSFMAAITICSDFGAPQDKV